MKILVTGANGQVGYCLSQQLKKTSWEYKLCTRTDLNISNAEMVENVCSEFRPDVIINAAAYTAVDKAESEAAQAFAINEQGVRNLVKFAKQNNSVLLHISTDYVFRGDKATAYSEDDPTDPQSIYGKSKLAGEQVIVENLGKFIILRTAWVFGEHGNNFVKTMLRLGKERDQLGVVADQLGGPTYAGDIAGALLKICAEIETSSQKINWGIYHFSGFPHVSWFEFAQEIFKQAEHKEIYIKSVPTVKAITTKDYPTPAKRPHNSKLKCLKLENEFGIGASRWQDALENIRAYTQ